MENSLLQPYSTSSNVSRKIDIPDRDACHIDRKIWRAFAQAHFRLYVPRRYLSHILAFNYLPIEILAPEKPQETYRNPPDQGLAVLQESTEL